MKQQTTMTPPVHLTLPADDPLPADGCRVCAALVKQRDTARRAGDRSKVSDCNVELKNHLASSGDHQ